MEFPSTKHSDRWGWTVLHFIRHFRGGETETPGGKGHPGGHLWRGPRSPSLLEADPDPGWHLAIGHLSRGGDR